MRDTHKIVESEEGRKKWDEYEKIVCPDGTVINMDELEDDQHRAQAALNHLAPALGGFISQLRYIYTFRVETQATDGFNIFVNPQFTASLDLTQKTFVMAHEIMHCLLNHMRRTKGRDPQKANIAADYEVNYTLVDIGLFKDTTIKGIGALYDEKWADMGMESIYDQLPSQSNPKNGKPKQGKGQGQSGQGQSGQGQSGEGSEGQGQQGQGESGEGQVQPQDCQPVTGSGQSGIAGEVISKEDGDKIAQAEGYPKEGGSDENIAKDWKARAEKAAAKMAGKGEGYTKLKAKLDNLYKVTKNWRKELAKIVGNCINPADKRYDYTNKNVLVSQHRIARTDKDKYDAMDYMMAWIDTSGSMSQEYLTQCLNEVWGVANAKHPMKLVVVQFDTRIADIREFKSADELKKAMPNMEIRGGGGTDVGDCFKMMMGKSKDKEANKKYGKKPTELVLIFTDGYLEQYRRIPMKMKNLIWVVVGNPAFELEYKEKNTRVVRISEEDFNSK